MKGGTKRWTVNLFVLVLLQASVFANAKNITSENAESPGKGEGSTSDLEGSETSFFSTFSTADHGFQRTFDPFVFPQHPTVTFSPTFSRSRSFFAVPNGTSNVHQEISCGDTFLRRCRKSRYRSYDGSCNNRHNPTWGLANTRYARLLPANYGDGVRSPTISVTGAELPPSRMVSYVLFPHQNIDDPIWTLAAMQWGQIITHDMAMIDGTTQSKSHTTRCCTNDGQLVSDTMLHEQCYPIIVPYNDPVYSPANIRCMNFVRSTTDLDRGCSSGQKPAEQLTVVSQYMDLSIVYGSDDQTAASLRAGFGGRLKVDVRNNREWPPAANNKSGVCDTAHHQEVCYQSGDRRVNQNPQLTILQIILLREHNRVAGVLAHINPHWTDETIFQETRRILIAEHQHISYYEWLPIFLGVSGTYGNKILYDTEGYVNDYDPHVYPNVLNEHSTAAFRYFHSLIAGFLNLVDEHRFHSPYNSLRLSDHFNRPGVIEEGNNMDDLTRGMSYQPEKASDRNFDEEITEYLFRRGRPLGSDLRAIDIQRNRDHGLASYNDYRDFCGLPRAKHFSGFLDFISASDVHKLSELYASPDDVELTVGGSLERHVEGALAGPTFLCILTRQFYRTRVGDRYWYERGDHELSFTIEQLAEIRKSSVSRLFCDNGDHILSMQPKGFQQVSSSNPIVSCDDLPLIDLTLWKDYAPGIANHVTNHFPDFRKK